jgi:hypothetical protein
MISTSNPSAPRKPWKLPASYNAVALPFLLTFFMTSIVSAIATWMSIGFTRDLPMKWLYAWGTSWCIAFPTVLFVLPLVRRIVAATVEPAESDRRSSEPSHEERSNHAEAQAR